MYAYIIISILLAFVLIHSYVSMRYGFDWIGNTTQKVIARTFNPGTVSVTDLYSIPAVPYMDRFGQYTKIPKMKENATY